MTTMGPATDAVNGESPLAPGVPMDNVCAMFRCMRRRSR